jgi:hypothetical protein
MLQCHFCNEVFNVGCSGLHGLTDKLVPGPAHTRLDKTLRQHANQPILACDRYRQFKGTRTGLTA